MNDRQRLEAIIAVVCKYLPNDGLSREEAMSQIIELVDPLPEQVERDWLGLTDDERESIVLKSFSKYEVGDLDFVACAVEAKLKEKNHG